MAKELPFYKFTATEWLTGDISFEDFDVQGLFISVCATYWAQDCQITLARLKQRLRNASSEQWQRLIDGNYIKVKGDNVSIKFLDEQIEELSGQHKKKVEAGRKGGQASVKQRLSIAEPTVNHKDIDIEEEQEVEKEKEKETVLSFSDFDIFWKAYDYNVGLRQTQAEWSAIAKEMPTEIAKILVHVPKYVASKPDKGYRKKPENYLKERSWNDEIVKTKQGQAQPVIEKFVPRKPFYPEQP